MCNLMEYCVIARSVFCDEAIHPSLSPLHKIPLANS
jgi:hypothetical protein